MMDRQALFAYEGLDGFLGTRASLMLDVVFLAMFAVLPVLAWSIWQVRYRRRYTLHKRVQLALGAVLAVAVTLFELDMRINGWEDRAEKSPYFGTATEPGLVYRALWVHLCFAVTTAILWIAVIVAALRWFPNPPAPGAHTSRHVFWGRLAALDLACTALTGWLFYWLAFVA
jgi:putative membrane protein